MDESANINRKVSCAVFCDKASHLGIFQAGPPASLVPEAIFQPTLHSALF